MSQRESKVMCRTAKHHSDAAPVSCGPERRSELNQPIRYAVVGESPGSRTYCVRKDNINSGVATEHHLRQFNKEEPKRNKKQAIQEKMLQTDPDKKSKEIVI
jgi:hypothetical protein